MNSVRRIFIKILLVFVALMVLCGAGFYVFRTHTIKNVYVEGNVHYTEEEVKEMVMKGVLGNNSLYLSMKYKNKNITDVPFVDIMNVDILSPDTIKITVCEKALAGFVSYMDTYMYFDKDGYVVENSSIKTAGVPQITGLSFDYMALGEPLPVEDGEVFNSILEIKKLLNKYELMADRIYFHPSGEITLYFANVKVSLGNDYATLEDKIMRLPTFLPELEGKSGVLQMENFSESNGNFTFKPDS